MVDDVELIPAKDMDLKNVNLTSKLMEDLDQIVFFCGLLGRNLRKLVPTQHGCGFVLTGCRISSRRHPCQKQSQLKKG